jgi:hypothetical protein
MEGFKKFMFNVAVSVTAGTIMLFASYLINKYIFGDSNNFNAGSLTSKPAHARVQQGLALYEVFLHYLPAFQFGSVAGIFICNITWFDKNRADRLRYATIFYQLIGVILGAFAGSVISLLPLNIMSLILISFGAFIGSVAGWIPLLINQRHAVVIPLAVFIAAAIGAVIGSVISRDTNTAYGVTAIIGLDLGAIAGGIIGGYLCGKKMKCDILKA